METLLRPSVERGVERVRGGVRTADRDRVAVEEPLEIRLGYTEKGEARRRSVSITMRTPGQDRELALGFLFSEGLLRSPSDVRGVSVCAQPNTIRVDLAPGAAVDLAKLDRHFYTTSSCGVCGKSSLEALSTAGLSSVAETGFSMSSRVLIDLPERARAAQRTFDETGGIHAAALFDGVGRLTSSFEDVGRHNAIDKVIGERFSAGALPLSDRLLFVSGRASFELVQKALMAGIPALAAVGAPSSLAVDLSRRFGMTLVGFLRGDRFNLYHGERRIT